MNNHLKSFYPDTNAADSNNSSINSAHGHDTSLNNTTTLTGGTPSSLAATQDSTEYEKKIILINKKLRSYEKRRQKLFFESKKKQEAGEGSGGSVGGENDGKISAIEGATGDSSETPPIDADRHSNSLKNGSSNGITASTSNPITNTTTNTTNTSANTASATLMGKLEAQHMQVSGTVSAPHHLGLHANTSNNLLSIPPQQQSTMSRSMNSDEILFNQFKSFNVNNGDLSFNSAAATGLNAIASSNELVNLNKAGTQPANLATTVGGAQVSTGAGVNPFYLSSELGNEMANANIDANATEDQANSSLVHTKSYANLDRERNMVRRIFCGLIVLGGG